MPPAGSKAGEVNYSPFPLDFPSLQSDSAVADGRWMEQRPAPGPERLTGLMVVGAAMGRFDEETTDDEAVRSAMPAALACEPAG